MVNPLGNTIVLRFAHHNSTVLDLQGLCLSLLNAAHI